MAVLHSLGRVGTSGEVADAVAFLLITKADRVTRLSMRNKCRNPRAPPIRRWIGPEPIQR